MSDKAVERRVQKSRDYRSNEYKKTTNLSDNVEERRAQRNRQASSYLRSSFLSVVENTR